MEESVCRIAKGKGGSKCPGPELTERERVIEASHALAEGNLSNIINKQAQIFS